MIAPGGVVQKVDFVRRLRELGVFVEKPMTSLAIQGAGQAGTLCRRRTRSRPEADSLVRWLGVD